MARECPRRKDPDDFRCHGADLGRRREKVGAGGPGVGIGDGYTECRQTRAVEKGKDEGGVGTEDGRNKRAGCMRGGRRALGGTRRMG